MTTGVMIAILTDFDLMKRFNRVSALRPARSLGVLGSRVDRSVITNCQVHSGGRHFAEGEGNIGLWHVASRLARYTASLRSPTIFRRAPP